MNKMMKVKYIASNISDLIKHINEIMESWDSNLEYRQEKLKEIMENEDSNSWDRSYAKEQVDEILANKEAAEEIIRYLEAYKF